MAGSCIRSLRRDSWFNAPGLLDTATGRITRLAADDVSDYPLCLLPDGRILRCTLACAPRYGNFNRGNSNQAQFAGVAEFLQRTT